MKDENLEVWFESIETLLKELVSKIENVEKGNTQKFDQVFEDFIIKMKSLRLTIPQQDLSPLVSKLDLILGEAKRISQPISLDEVKREHYFFFFPDLKAWLDRINRARVSWSLAILLAASVLGNWYLWKDYNEFKRADLKIRYLRYFGSTGPKQDLKAVDSLFSIKSSRDITLRSIRNYELTTMQEQQRVQRIKDLQSELDSLTTK